MYYAIHTVFDPMGPDSNVYAFETRAARDRFVAVGPRGSWSLVFPFEQKQIPARDARKLARRDGFGDPYAVDYDGGVIYPWGSPGYEKEAQR